MATQKKTWERWRWGGVGVLVIYSEGFSRSCWESQQLRLKPGPNSGDFRPGTPGGSIRREVVCGLPVNPKQKKTKWRQQLICVIFPQGTYSGVNAICTKCSGVISAGTKYGKVLGVNAAITAGNIFREIFHALMNFLPFVHDGQVQPPCDVCPLKTYK